MSPSPDRLPEGADSKPNAARSMYMAELDALNTDCFLRLWTRHMRQNRVLDGKRRLHFIISSKLCGMADFSVFVNLFMNHYDSKCFDHILSTIIRSSCVFLCLLA